MRGRAEAGGNVSMSSCIGRNTARIKCVGVMEGVALLGGNPSAESGRSGAFHLQQLPCSLPNIQRHSTECRRCSGVCVTVCPSIRPSLTHACKRHPLLRPSAYKTGASGMGETTLGMWIWCKGASCFFSALLYGTGIRHISLIKEMHSVRSWGLRT